MKFQRRSFLCSSKILVPVDGSGTADNALRYGVEMAKTYEARLFVTVVADIGEAAYP